MRRPEASLRVQHFIPSLAGGGAERQLRQLAPLLVARGIDVSLVSRLENVDLLTLEAGGVRCYPLRSRGNHDLRLLVEAVRAIRSFRPHLVQTWLPQMDVFGGVAARLAGVPHIVSERSAIDAYPRTAKNQIRHRLALGADAIIANSPAGVAVWQDHQSTFLVPNGVDLAAIDAVPPDALAHADSLRGRTVVVTVARLAVEKRLDVLVRAIALARNRVPGILLVLAGDGAEQENLRRLVGELGLDEHVHFAGYQPNVWAWMKSASLFASLSVFEGHPNAVLEAAAAGVPMLLSDIPMHRMPLGEAARYVDAANPERVADALVSMVLDERGTSALARAARGKVEKLSMNVAADRYVEIYRQLARR